MGTSTRTWPEACLPCLLAILSISEGGRTPRHTIYKQGRQRRHDEACCHVTPQPGTQHGREDRSDRPAGTQDCASGCLRSWARAWGHLIPCPATEMPAPQPEACLACLHVLSPSPEEPLLLPGCPVCPAVLRCLPRPLQLRPMPCPAPKPLSLWSFVAAAPGE